MGLVDKIKSDVKKSGTNKGKFIFFKEGAKARIRFLQEMDDGMEIVFHDNYEAGVNTPCQEIFGRECPYCDDETMRTRSLYCWSVWDYEAKEVKLFMFPVNNCSPVPSLVALNDTYGTLMDRDFVIQKTGKQQNTSYTVIPMDKNKFRNSSAKPFSKSAVLKMLDKAYPCEGVDSDDDYEDDEDTKPNTKAKSNDDWDDDDAGNDYSEMSAKELYKLCKERKIEVEPKKNAKYYINLLEEYDEAQDDWGDDDDEDDGWDD